MIKRARIRERKVKVKVSALSVGDQGIRRRIAGTGRERALHLRIGRIKDEKRRKVIKVERVRKVEKVKRKVIKVRKVGKDKWEQRTRNGASGASILEEIALRIRSPRVPGPPRRV